MELIRLLKRITAVITLCTSQQTKLRIAPVAPVVTDMSCLL